MIIVMAFLVGGWLAAVDDDRAAITIAQGAAMARSMAVYRSRVLAWARLHPGFEGPVDDTLLALPAWWRGHAVLKAVIEGRLVAVYLTDDAGPGVLDELSHLSEGSILVGTVHRSSNTLHSPTFGETGIPVPKDVPDHATLWMAARD